MQFNQKSNVATATRVPPTKRTKLPNGDIVVEKIPPQPFSRKMVSMSGTVVRVPFATGRTLGGETNNPYYAKFYEKKKRGMLLYAECPYANGDLQIPPGVTPCKGHGEGRPGQFWRPHPASKLAFVEDECCEHIEEIIARRTAAHNEKQAEEAKRYQNSQDLLVQIEQQKAQAAAAPLVANAELAKLRQQLADAQAQLAATVSAPEPAAPSVDSADEQEWDDVG